MWSDLSPHRKMVVCWFTAWGLSEGTLGLWRNTGVAAHIDCSHALRSPGSQGWNEMFTGCLFECALPHYHGIIIYITCLQVKKLILWTVMSFQTSKLPAKSADGAMNPGILGYSAPVYILLFLFMSKSEFSDHIFLRLKPQSLSHLCPNWSTAYTVTMSRMMRCFVYAFWH